MKSRFQSITLCMAVVAIIPISSACGGSSNSDIETNLRAQLSETQSQLEQAQDLITRLQDQIGVLEIPIETEVTETETETEGIDTTCLLYTSPSPRD